MEPRGEHGGALVDDAGRSPNIITAGSQNDRIDLLIIGMFSGHWTAVPINWMAEENGDERTMCISLRDSCCSTRFLLALSPWRLRYGGLNGRARNCDAFSVRHRHLMVRIKIALLEAIFASVQLFLSGGSPFLRHHFR